MVRASSLGRVKPVLAAALLGLLFYHALLDAAPTPPAGGQKVRFVPSKGRVRVEGTSNLDNWQVETRAIEGFLEVGPEFLHPGQPSSLSPGAARAEIVIEVRALKSIEKDGKPFSNKMDEIMYETLKARDHPNIRYRLDHLVLKHSGKGHDAANEFEGRGHLMVAGVTNEISMPVSVSAVGASQLRIWGNATLKMTDFQIDPPSPKIALGLIKTGDEIKFAFDWLWTRRE
jgi:hypothetical protein